MNPALDPALTRIVGGAARRLRLDRALRVAVRAAVWTMTALVAVSATGVVVPVPVVSPWAGIVAAAAAALVAAGVIFFPRADLIAPARPPVRPLHRAVRAGTRTHAGVA